MSSHLPLGAHHAHLQPRRSDGTFVSYAQAGRRLGQHVARSQRIIVTRRGVWTAPAR